MRVCSGIISGYIINNTSIERQVMNIVAIDDREDLFSIKELLPNELLDELSKVDLMNIPFTKMDWQEHWNRRNFKVEPNSVFEKISQYINSQKELISASIGVDIDIIDPRYWLDLEGFTVNPHIDNPGVKNVMQVYLSDYDNAGTNFYNIKDSEVETKDDAQRWHYVYNENTPLEIRNSYECIKNTGYIMINNKTQLHGNPEMSLGKDAERLSLYCYLSGE